MNVLKDLSLVIVLVVIQLVQVLVVGARCYSVSSPLENVFNMPSFGYGYRLLITPLELSAVVRIAYSEINLL